MKTNTKYLDFEQIKKKLEYYCTYQDRCHDEVEKKLNEFVLHPELKEEIIFFLITNNFLNEERFAKSYVRGKFYQKQWGKNKIIQALKQKKITNMLINDALQEIAIEDYKKTLVQLILKKKATIKETNAYVIKHKLLQYAFTRGYETDVVQDTIKEILI